MEPQGLIEILIMLAERFGLGGTKKGLNKYLRDKGSNTLLDEWTHKVL
jgi:hypothetical protein